MKTLKTVFFSIGIISAVFLFSTHGIAVGSDEPLPPPADILFTLENTPQVGQEAILKLSVTPLEDMHLDISCALPEGVMPVMEPGLMIQPHVDRNIYTYDENVEPPPEYYAVQREAIGLWVGPVTAGQVKEFIFHVTIPNTGSYEFIAVVEALAQWGFKEEILVVEIN